MPSLTEQLQTNIRAITGTVGQYNEDWHALCDLAGIAKGQINERILAYYNSFNSGPVTVASAGNYFQLNPAAVTGGTVAGIFLNGEPGAVFIAAKPTAAWVANPDLVTMYQDNLGTTPVTALEQTVGLHLDTRPIVGKPTGPNTVGQPLYGASLIATGTIGLIGAATAATYNTGTGAGAATRVAAANQSYVTFAATAQTFLRLRIQNTGATSLTVYSGTPAGTALATVANGVTTYLTLPMGAATALSIAPTTDATSITFTVLALQLSYGNHRSQSSAPARAKLSARYNKVTARNANPVDLTGVPFTNATNGLATCTVVNDAAALAAAGLSSKCTLGQVYKIDNTLGDTGCFVVLSGTTGTANSHVLSVWARRAGGAAATLEKNGGGGVTIPISANYGFVTTTQSMITTSQLAITVGQGGVVFFILPDMRESCYSYLPTPQVVWDATTGYDDTGFPARLVYSGAQGSATGSIDFSGSDKLQVVHGYAKLQDAATAVMIESDVALNTSIGFYIPRGAASANIGSILRNLASVSGFTSDDATSPSNLTVPVVGVGTALLDWGAATGPTQNILRNNGAQVAVGAQPLTAGVFAPSSALYFGQRNGGTLPYTGDEFISIVRGGATPSTGVIGAIERYCSLQGGTIF